MARSGSATRRRDSGLSLFGHFLGMATGGEDAGELRQSSERREAANPRNGAANEHVAKQILEERQALDKEVAIPEGRPPGGHNQHESRLEKIRREENAGDDRDDQPPVCTRVSRSARAETSW